MKTEIQEILANPANMITSQYSKEQINNAFKAGQKSIVEAVRVLYEVSKMDGSSKNIVDSMQIAYTVTKTLLP